VVRRIAMGDLDQVMAIERGSFNTPWEREVFAEELERPWARLLGLFSDQLLAFVNYWVVDDEMHILNLATHPKHRNGGHATRLLRHVVSSARRRSARLLTLEVRRSNLVAQRLYERQGFRPVGLRKNYYVDDREDAIVMVCELAP
jgi:ribosomal-protein-alanine N-acetyltransferase